MVGNPARGEFTLPFLGTEQELALRAWPRWGGRYDRTGPAVRRMAAPAEVD